jgi:2-amino-4-hydroxy-6-hydroxymethyldihydropteridine diphosphokinase
MCQVCAFRDSPAGQEATRREIKRLLARPVAVIALGSNLPSAFGTREDNLRIAFDYLRSLGDIACYSRFYDTEPVGYLDQPHFLNATVALRTDLQPLELLQKLLAIEHAMGRDRSTTVDKGPRVIDLDLLLYGDVTMNTPELTLPHPAMHERRFVLEPMAEMLPEMVHPVLGKTIRELLEAFPA